MHKNGGTVSNCYWVVGCGSNVGISSPSSNTNATPISIDNLKSYSSVLGSAFTSDSNNINNGYPILRWQLTN